MDWTALLNDYGLPIVFLVVFGFAIRILWKKLEREQYRYDVLARDYREEVDKLHGEKERIAKEFMEALETTVRALRRHGGNNNDRRP